MSGIEKKGGKSDGKFEFLFIVLHLSVGWKIFKQILFKGWRLFFKIK
jgi:hypothetical protein